MTRAARVCAPAGRPGGRGWAVRRRWCRGAVHRGACERTRVGGASWAQGDVAPAPRGAPRAARGKLGGSTHVRARRLDRRACAAASIPCSRGRRRRSRRRPAVHLTRSADAGRRVPPRHARRVCCVRGALRRRRWRAARLRAYTTGGRGLAHGSAPRLKLDACCASAVWPSRGAAPAAARKGRDAPTSVRGRRCVPPANALRSLALCVRRLQLMPATCDTGARRHRRAFKTYCAVRAGARRALSSCLATPTPLSFSRIAIFCSSAALQEAAQRPQRRPSSRRYTLTCVPPSSKAWRAPERRVRAAAAPVAGCAGVRVRCPAVPCFAPAARLSGTAVYELEATAWSTTS